MARDPLASLALRQAASVVTQKPGNPWKPLAIVLALLLVAVLIATALVATDVMKLGFSLL
jgi:hypothetical protein